jgi:putative Holliday junction resolvase
VPSGVKLPTSHFSFHLALGTLHLALPIGPVCYHASVRFVAIDFGLRRIGLAVSDATGTLARPFRTIERRAGDTDTRAISSVLEAVSGLDAAGDTVDALVVGLPRRLDGTPNDQTPHVEAFVARLREAASLPVHLQDERLTSHEADARLAAGERDWRKRKARLDAAAAAVILQDYLDAHTPMPAWLPDDSD